jgi:FAD/FMN-containing dehydrogenase
MTSPSTTLAARLESAIGPSHVAADPTVCAAYAVDELFPAAVAKPSSTEEVVEIVRFAALEKLALIPCGNRTKLAIGMPPSRYDIALDMAALDRIAHYDPGDLTLSVDAGLPLAKLNAALSERRQFLPLLVPWYSRSTIGGTIASGVDSPLRQFYGTARDFLIGAEFVDGTGKLCKSGGRVVKNVTGYDLHKLLIGSLGTLAVITRLNFRTFPAPPASRGFVASFPSLEGALALRRAITQSPLTPLTLDILSPSLAQLFVEKTPAVPEPAVFASETRGTDGHSLPPIGAWFRPHEWQLCAAFGGTPEVLDRYARELTRFAEQTRVSSTTTLDDSTRPSLWGRLRETLSLLLESFPSAAIFRLGVLPSHHSSLIPNLQEIAERLSLRHALVARSVGTLYFALQPSLDDPTSLHPLTDAATAIFDLCSKENTCATLPWCPTELKRTINIWGNLCVAPASSRLFPPESDFPGSRLKSAFDPHNIFSPGRLP